MLTHLLNEAGLIESEITITRLGPGHFFVLSAALAQLHDMDQFCWRRRPDEDVTITDRTDDFGTLVLAGPRARDVLARCTGADLSNTAFRWLTGKTITVAGIPVRALRMNYVGELGWELHCPMADMPIVFDAIMAAGKPHGIRLFGTYAMNSLRMEKCFRAWGSELTTEIDMFEAGMDRFIRLDKPDFIGRTASLARQQRGKSAMLVMLEVEAGDSDCLGAEPVYEHGKLVGLTTGGAYGHAVEKSLAFAYVSPDAGTDFEITLLGQTRKARMMTEPPWDPQNLRQRS